MLQRRKELGMTQAEVARRTGLSVGGYSHIESGRRPNPGAMTLWYISRALEVPIEELMGGREE